MPRQPSVAPSWGDIHIHIHVDAENDSLININSNSILDSIGFSQCSQTYSVLWSYPWSCADLGLWGNTVNSSLSMPCLIWPFFDNFLVHITWLYSFWEYFYRCLSENAVTRFKKLIPSSFSSLRCANMTEDSYLTFTPVKLDSLVDSTTV